MPDAAINRAAAGPARLAKWRPRVTAAALITILIGTMAACGGGSNSPAASPTPSGSHRLTAEEAQRLAQMRYVNYQGVGVEFDATVSTTDGVITAHGYANYHEMLGLAVVTAQSRSDLLEWNNGTLAVWTGVADKDPPSTLPGKPSGNRPLERSGNPLDTTLQVVLTLGSDKPDNASALRKSNALWLRHDTIDGTVVDVMAGPAAPGKSSAVTYWVGTDGRLLRVEVNVGGTPAPTEINLDAGGFRTFPRTGVLTG